MRPVLRAGCQLGGVLAVVGELDAGRASFRRQAWTDAFTRLSSADREAALEPDDLGLLAVAAYLLGRDTDSARARARAFSLLQSQGATQGAARCAFWLAFELMNAGEMARAGGWLEAAAAGHGTWLSGPVHGQLPFDLEGRPARQIMRLLWFAASHVLTMKTPLGRKMRPEVRAHGGPLLRVKLPDLAAAGVKHVSARTVAAREGLPTLDDGRALDVANVIWCTGFRPDFSWIHVPVTGSDGWPDQDRGVAASAPGLYFVGLLFQYAFSSMLVGGAGRDAEHVARHIARQPDARHPARPTAEPAAATTRTS